MTTAPDPDQELRIGRRLRVDHPEPGNWVLRVAARTATPQRSYFVAHVENAAPTCEVVTSASRTSGSELEIRASARLKGTPFAEGVTLTGRVFRPDGGIVPLTFDPPIPRAAHFVAHFADFSGRGAYRVEVSCDLAAGARAAPGESFFAPGLSAADEAASVSFHREASTAFFGDFPFDRRLVGVVGDDCDGDTLQDSIEAPGDTDQDGLPDICDDDGDGDDVWDGVDVDPQDPTLGRCDTPPDVLACCPSIDDCAGTAEVALFAAGSLRLSDRVRVNGAGALVVNAGARETNLGVESVSDVLFSAASVILRDRARVNGEVLSGGSISLGAGATIGGRSGSERTLRFPNLSRYSVEFPPATEGNVSVEPDQPTLALGPGLLAHGNAAQGHGDAPIRAPRPAVALNQCEKRSREQRDHGHELPTGRGWAELLGCAGWGHAETISHADRTQSSRKVKRSIARRLAFAGFGGVTSGRTAWAGVVQSARRLIVTKR